MCRTLHVFIRRFFMNLLLPLCFLTIISSIEAFEVRNNHKFTARTTRTTKSTAAKNNHQLDEQREQQPHLQHQHQRRRFFQYVADGSTTTAAALIVATTATFSSVSPALAAVGDSSLSSPPVLSSKYCAQGVGDDCDSLSEGNELIRSLQAKSAENRELNARQAREAYYMKNYPDFFASVGKTMIKRSDGTFFLVDDNELEELKRQNKLTTEMPTAAMGGDRSRKFTDLTQKPFLVLKDE